MTRLIDPCHTLVELHGFLSPIRAMHHDDIQITCTNLLRTMDSKYYLETIYTAKENKKLN